MAIGIETTGANIGTMRGRCIENWAMPVRATNGLSGDTRVFLVRLQISLAQIPRAALVRAIEVSAFFSHGECERYAPGDLSGAPRSRRASATSGHRRARGRMGGEIALLGAIQLDASSLRCPPGHGEKWGRRRIRLSCTATIGSGELVPALRHPDTAMVLPLPGSDQP